MSYSFIYLECNSMYAHMCRGQKRSSDVLLYNSFLYSFETDSFPEPGDHIYFFWLVACKAHQKIFLLPLTILGLQKQARRYQLESSWLCGKHSQPLSHVSSPFLHLQKDVCIEVEEEKYQVSHTGKPIFPSRNSLGQKGMGWCISSPERKSMPTLVTLFRKVISQNKTNNKGIPR